VGREIDRLVPLNIRAAALMPAAVLTVHQLRFQLAFGGRAESRLASEGHQYLGALAPIAAMILAIGVGLFLATVSRAWRRGMDQEEEGRRPASTFARTWLLAAVALLAIYCGQELLEGFLASGHPGGIAGVFGEGGLWAVPLSAALGAVVALGLRIADVAVRWAAGRSARSQVPRSPIRLFLPAAGVFLALREPLADAAAGRAPPSLLPLTS
jgi:hypothetical protein